MEDIYLIYIMENCTVARPLGFIVTNSSLPSQFALPHLRKTEGNIINISSLVASLGQVGAVPYVATKVSSQLDCSRSRCSVPIWSAPVMSTFYHKGAIISMTKAMAVDESRFKVRVNW